jgi:hypothetical protein
MKTSICVTLVFVSLGMLAPGSENGAETSPYSYFDALVASPAHFKSYSLRSAQQVLAFKNASSLQPWVTYDPQHDSDGHAQDAAKVVIPAFKVTPATLAAPLGATDAFVTLSEFDSSTWGNKRGMKIDGEILTIDRPSGTTILDNRVPVLRGQNGTAKASHSVGAAVLASNNSLLNQVRVPIDSVDGHTYLITWDAYWTDSYLSAGITNHKAFQLTSGGDKLWLETQMRFDGGATTASGFSASRDVASVEMRSYQAFAGSATWAATDGNTMGPGTTANQPIAPKSASFVVKPNTWTRFWIRIQQRANDYDLMDLWVADETRAPVQIYKQIPISVRPTGTPANAIHSLWLEYNTSTDAFRGSAADLVSYVRNIVVLRDAADVTSLLQSPGSGVAITPALAAPLPTTAVPTPVNVRIIR